MYFLLFSSFFSLLTFFYLYFFILI